MTIERKFIDLKSLKVSDDGPGTIEGYRSVFNEIDEGGDIVVKGAFEDCTAEYLSSGFTAHSHDWDFDKAVGFPIEAHEDEHGWFVKSQFHSTPDSQAIRTKAKERLEAGKQVGFSFGYSPTEFSHIDAKDYEKDLVQYIKADRLADNLAKAQKFNRIRILKKVDVIEDSLVTAPMNKRAAATAVKSEVASEPLLKEDPVSASFESFDDVVAALEKQTANMQRNHENRTKEGRVLSSSNRARLQAAREAIDALLVASEPPPKEIDVVEALRTQSLRLESEALAALAP